VIVVEREEEWEICQTLHSLGMMIHDFAATPGILPTFTFFADHLLS
jgi:hypothetical protein